MSGYVELPDGPSDAISSLAFSHSTGKLAVGSWDRTLSFYEPQGDSFVRETGIQARAPVLDVCWSEDEPSRVYFVGLDYDVRSVDTSSADGEQTVLSTHGAASNKVAYSKEERIVISTSWDGTMHVHDPKEGRHTRVRLAAKPFALALSNNRCVVAMAERKVSVYDLHALRMLVEQAGTTTSDAEVMTVEPWQSRESSLKFMTRSIACMPDGTGFAASSIEGRVGVEWFAEEEQKKTYAFKCHRQTEKITSDEGEGEVQEVDIVYPVNALAFHPIHGTFATGGGDGVVAFWDAQTKRRIKQFPKLEASVAALEFSADGRTMAVAMSPGFEDGKEDEEVDTSVCKVFVRALGENEAKGKEAKK
ncbi:spindle assembly checkpoint protein [Teratosphaeria nubilosa]|uniref:Spindle assembly checkpoint protein n=1 Tax=Teratosphaeria nubilosa TaxID=161662 RepID=A0A6G1LFQ1_9PEZI|nr:spindle assembly checkpoint protein [Teratosphaeria nubilosa]